MVALEPFGHLAFFDRQSPVLAKCTIAAYHATWFYFVLNKISYQINGERPIAVCDRDLFIRPTGRIFLSTERSKLCFELLEILSAAQNNLPLQGAGNNLRSRCFNLNDGIMEKGNGYYRDKGGRKPKADPAKYRYSISFTAEENSRFLSLFEESGMQIKAHFITACIFQSPIKTLKVDKGTIDYYMRLTTLYGQFRSVGVNYNQVVKILYANFSEKKAAAYLYRLEKQTMEMARLCANIMDITKEFEAKYLLKRNK